MADFTGGYTSALNSASERDLRTIETMLGRERLKQARDAFAQQQSQRASRAELGNILPYLLGLNDDPQGPPPSPPPGQPSVPMLPPPPQQGVQPPMPPRPMGPPTAAGPPMGSPAMAGQFLTTPPPPAPAQGPPGAGAPMPQGGGQGAPMPQMRTGMNASAPPGAGGPPPMSLPPPPDRWKSLPAPPGGGPGGPGMLSAPPAPAENAVMPRELVSVKDMAKLLASRGIKGEKLMNMLDQWKPFMDSQNKTELDAMKIKLTAEQAGTRAYQAALKAALEGRKIEDQEKRDASTAQYRSDRMKQRDREFAAKHGGGEPGKPGVANPPKDAASETSLDLQAWRYLNDKGLPYRKGTGGGKDKNDAVLHRAGEIANEMQMSAEELMAMPAEFKANAQSMAFQTKKLDAIEGQLRSFHNNIDTWDSLAQGIAPKLGGDRVKAMAKDLEKINFAGVKSFDEVKLKLESQFNDPTASAYLVATMAAAMDYARIMQGPQSIASLTEGARQDAERLLSAGMDDRARKAVIGTLESDTQGQVKGIRDQLDNIRGRLRSPSGRKAAGGDGAAREFKSEAEAKAAGLKDGDRVKINGVAGTWKN